MNKHRRSSSGIWIGMLFIVALPLMVYSQTRPNGSAPQQEASPTVQVIGETPTATPIVIEFVPTETPYVPPFTPFVIIEPTWTPWSTMTPWPTPTLKPNPTATSLPVIKPADNPSGQLIYMARTAFNADMAGYHTEGEAFAIQVDSKGTSSQPASMNIKGWYHTYLSWDRNQIALVSTYMLGDNVSILNAAAGKVDSVPALGDSTGFFSGWSPNNQEIVFLADRNATGGLWLVNTTTEERTIVVQQPSLYIMDAAVSPDGQQIIYAQQKDVFSPIELWTVFANGSDAKKISSNGGIGLSWSPDGKKIAYMGSGLCLISLENPECKVLATDVRNVGTSASVWSPDGAYLAFVAIDLSRANEITQQHKDSKAQDWDKEQFEGSSIHLIQMATGEERVLISSESFGSVGGVIDPVWSPDGSMLAFAGFDGGTASLWTIHIDGTQLQQVAKSSDLIRFPVWSSNE